MEPKQHSTIQRIPVLVVNMSLGETNLRDIEINQSLMCYRLSLHTRNNLKDKSKNISHRQNVGDLII